MTSLDAPLRKAAKTLTGKFGKLALIEYVATGSYDPSTGKSPEHVLQQASVRGVVEQYTSAEIDGLTVRRGDLKWTIAAKDVTAPGPNDMVTLDGTRYTVKGVEAVFSGDESALHIVQLRR